MERSKIKIIFLLLLAPTISLAQINDKPIFGNYIPYWDVRPSAYECHCYNCAPDSIKNKIKKRPTKQYEYNTTAEVYSGYSECGFQLDEPFEWDYFTIQHTRWMKNKYGLIREMEATLFRADRNKETVVISPCGLDSLIKDANYILINGVIFKRQGPKTDTWKTSFKRKSNAFHEQMNKVNKK